MSIGSATGELVETHLPTLDGISYKAAEVDRLEAEVELHTQVGRSALRQAVLSGKQDPAVIRANQTAVQELLANDELRNGLGEALKGFGPYESEISAFRKGAYRTEAYAALRGGMQAVESFGALASGSELDHPQAAVLRTDLQTIHELDGSTLGSRLRGPLYYTPRGLRGREELGWYNLGRVRFRPVFSGRLAVLMVGGLVAVRTGVVPHGDALFLASAETAAIYGSAIGLIPANRSGSMKASLWNDPTVYRSLRRQINRSSEWEPAMQAIGRLDMLHGLSQLHRRMEANGHDVVFPDIEESDVYHLKAQGLKNPLLALQAGRKLVANSLELGGDQRLTFLSGPNSGGKSTISKALVMNQVLAQTGGSVVAQEASLTPAEHIAYHVPMPPDLNDETGRFGFELKRVADILDEVSPRSLTVLDDCLDGTTHEERVATLKQVMQAFDVLGGGTLFSTHAHELVSQFAEHSVGQFVQVSFTGEAPTYRIEPGISHTSHAAKVADQHGLSRDKLWAKIRERTGANPEQWF